MHNFRAASVSGVQGPDDKDIVLKYRMGAGCPPAEVVCTTISQPRTFARRTGRSR